MCCPTTPTEIISTEEFVCHMCWLRQIAQCILAIQRTIKVNKLLRGMKEQCEENENKWLSLMSTAILEIQRRTISRRLEITNKIGYAIGVELMTE